MKTSVVQGLVAVAGLTVAASSLLAQAPTSAQVWDVRFVVDSSGPYAEGPFATQVGITIMARVGILPNSTAAGTANLGISRVGGSGTATSGFHMVFSDPFSAGLGLSQGTVSQGLTNDIDGRGLVDTNGNPLAGSFGPLRGSFSPQVFPQFLGSNDDVNNGGTNNPATGSPSLFNVIGGRQFNFGSEGTGAYGNAATAVDANPANLVGDLVPIYRMYYVPREDGSNPLGRLVTVSVSGIQARYIYQLQGTNGQSGSTINLGGATFTFRVPTPGAAGLAGLAMVAGLRRRRA